MFIIIIHTCTHAQNLCKVTKNPCHTQFLYAFFVFRLIFCNFVTMKKTIYDILTLFILVLPIKVVAQDFEKIDSLLSQDMFRRTNVGMMVWDLDADSLLFEHNSQQLLRPASTMKLITAITAINTLGTDYSFETNLYINGVQDSTTLKGNVYVKGGMNPTFDNIDMEAFVNSIVELGIDTIKGSLIADRSFKDDLEFGEGWCWDDKNPSLTPLLYKRKDNFFSTFGKMLLEKGIVIVDGYCEGQTPTDARLIATRSNSLETILWKAMKDSDNLYAESIYYHIAASRKTPATAKTAQKVEKELVERIGLNPDGYRFADGSGLSLYNYVTAELEVMFLRYAYQNKHIYNLLRYSLPIAGVDGTLKKRMQKTSAYENVVAKTGTVTGVSSLAGYCKSPEGHTIAFAIINQGILKTSEAKDFQDSVCIALTSSARISETIQNPE